MKIKQGETQVMSVVEYDGLVVSLATSMQASGAVAVIDVCGEADALVALLLGLVGRNDWPVGRVFLSRFDDIDEGLACRVTPTHGQLMPHGGQRVVRRLLDRVVELGARESSGWRGDVAREGDLRGAKRGGGGEVGGWVVGGGRYPEARDEYEAMMLATMARAASPAAIDVLLDQPALWRGWKNALPSARESVEVIAKRSVVLDRLLVPPTVVVVGRPNVGKSTLANRVLGRSASLVADLPGTTRDWVGGLVTWHGVAIRWLDTPGLRASHDTVEQAAIQLATRVIEQADVLIRMRDPEHDWPAPEALPRPADLHIINKIDLHRDNNQGRTHEVSDNTLSISAATGQGIDQLTDAVLAQLKLDTIPRGLWSFNDQWRDAIAQPFGV